MEMCFKGNLFIISKQRKNVLNFFCQKYLKGSYSNRTRTKKLKTFNSSRGHYSRGYGIFQKLKNGPKFAIFHFSGHSLNDHCATIWHKLLPAAAPPRLDDGGKPS